MSPEQLKQLQKLSQLFEEGSAGSEQIKELSELLAEVNHIHEELSAIPKQASI
ncbi:hypothetical protein [Thalassotalea piscium]|uniref:Chaperonin cofactor prefoldin n=1 Tax=Thalassotalea piscium TaxID=1230533 RepID=A0A7X0NJQ3_9GAMM|nr:hypothetical protein [Thalassotalea piscium]MBB6544684.1 chaperonin cofactor prefoldin [Thalassotalea piscium]